MFPIDSNPPEDLPQRSITVAEAAGLLSCDPTTVRRLLDRGELSGHRLGKSGVRIFASSIIAYQQRQAIVPTSPREAERPRHRRQTASFKAAMAYLRATGTLK